MEALNQQWFLSINADGASPAWLLAFAAFAADYLLYGVPVMLAGLWLWGQQREAAVKALFVTLIALGIGQLIGLVYMHPRPFMIPLGHSFALHAPDTSFPSDHGILFFSVSLALMLGGARLWGSLVFVVGLVVVWSRVYLGIHFPFDMAGALLVAIASSMIVWAAWNPLGRWLMGLVERLYRRMFVVPIAKGWIRE
ncbi:phosphatase PAP2 family protein [Thiothrix lacustris]|uniref:phosphatase PAP2 family protein n=1 Tax=Thiothrix lacustris TaxID=525917 RepID=UPI0027E3F57A|nr:phosphatase PAP2 family protein [Thiothrix lacustris]WMP18770.1 phosphatase PAP2 family protein [Thiothrix lacustris]